MSASTSLLFTLSENDAGDFIVTLRIDDRAPVSAPFDFNLAADSRIARVLDAIEYGNCREDNLQDVGSQLWTGLCSDVVFDAIFPFLECREGWFTVRLALPPALRRLPWEAMYDEKTIGFLASHNRWCIIREPEVSSPPPQPLESLDEIGLLVVIPEGAGLMVDNEIANIKSAVAQLNRGLKFEALRGSVFPDRLNEELQSGSWDIVHFIGHGEISDADKVLIRLNEEGRHTDKWLGTEEFASMFMGSGVKLCVMNCCHGGVASMDRTMDGLAPALIRADVDAVIAMRYAVSDDVAIRFSRSFYQKLLEGERAGQVDYAVQFARNSLYRNADLDNKRSFITPVFHVVHGREKQFDISRKEEPEEDGNGNGRINLKVVPEELLAAFRDGRCVPVIGAEIVSPPTERNSAVDVPSYRALIESLAVESEYPEMDKLAQAEQPGQLAQVFMAQVSEHFVSTHKRFKLIETIRAHCERHRPTDIHLGIASWPVPGLFYTHFDGLMEAAFTSLGYTPTVAHDLEGEYAIDERLLVLVRGSISNFRTLVLTEHDHEKLVDVLSRMNHSIRSLTTEHLGRSLLFLGVHPRDPAVRRLARQLIESGPTGMQGRPYFVSAHYNKVDQNYWGAFDVQWIQAEPAEFARAVTAQVGTSAGRND